jgi:hypothetical protein
MKRFNIGLINFVDIRELQVGLELINTNENARLGIMKVHKIYYYFLSTIAVTFFMIFLFSMWVRKGVQ